MNILTGRLSLSPPYIQTEQRGNVEHQNMPLVIGNNTYICPIKCTIRVSYSGCCRSNADFYSCMTFFINNRAKFILLNIVC
jgi:hypothetical protein